MKKWVIISFVFLFVAFILFSNYLEEIIQKENATKPYYIRSYPDCYKPFVEKDKDIIIRTVWKIIDSVRNDKTPTDYTISDRYGEYTYGIRNKRPADSIWVDTLFYSPDCTKTIAFIIIKCSNPGGLFNYDCKTIFGIRDTLGEPWRLYGWNQIQASGFHSARSASDSTIAHYVSNYIKYSDVATIYMKDWSQKAVKFGYNLRDSAFWDSCIIWRPNTRGKGIYLFQTCTAGIRADQQLPDINVELTESEMELFRKEKAACK